jgi:hypothetical protein
MDGDSGIIEIPLKDAIGTVNRAVEDEIDDLIATADTMMGPGARFHELALLPGDQKGVLSLPDRILERTEPAGSILDTVYFTYGNIPRSAQNPLCHWVSHDPSIQENPPQLISCHDLHIPLTGGFSTFWESLKSSLLAAQKYFFDHSKVRFTVKEQLGATSIPRFALQD